MNILEVGRESLTAEGLALIEAGKNLSQSFVLAVEEILKISGKVVINNKRDGKKMSTEELFWSPATQKIYTDKFIIIETASEIIQGEGMDATQDFSSYTIRTVTGIVSVK